MSNILKFDIKNEVSEALDVVLGMNVDAVVIVCIKDNVICTVASDFNTLEVLGALAVAKEYILKVSNDD